MKYFLVIVSFSFIIACRDYGVENMRSTYFITEEWEFCQRGVSSWYSAQVPGQIHLDLLSNDLIEDPYWQDNENELRWIEEESWIYKTEFNFDKDLAKTDKVEIVFQGLDTYADVFLNDKKILSLCNMFREWNVDIMAYLKRGKNDLRIIFHSPIEINRDDVRKYPYLLPSGNESKEIPVKVSSFTRKAAYHFGWDWGPRFVTSGIWKPIKIEFWNKAKINSVYTRTLSINSDQATMQTVVELECSESGAYRILMGRESYEFELTEGENIILIDFQISDPELWWTNGLGEPKLYNQELRLFSGRSLLDSVKDRFGIRTITLVQEPDSFGTSFFFLLNGKPVFMKGANYIPQDMFLSRVSDQKYVNLISKVRG